MMLQCIAFLSRKEPKVYSICFCSHLCLRCSNVFLTLTTLSTLTILLYRCHTNDLKKSEENPGRWDILQVGNVDTFQHGIQLGSCLNVEEFKSHQRLLVFEVKSFYHKDDDWLMDYAVVLFEDGSMWSCHNSYDHWLEVGTGYTIRCTKKRGEYFKPKTNNNIKR